MCKENNVGVALVDQSLLDNIYLTLGSIANPSMETLSGTNLAVATYKAFQEALLIKNKREQEIRNE